MEVESRLSKDRTLCTNELVKNNPPTSCDSTSRPLAVRPPGGGRTYSSDTVIGVISSQEYQTGENTTTTKSPAAKSPLASELLPAVQDPLRTPALSKPPEPEKIIHDTSEDTKKDESVLPVIDVVGDSASSVIMSSLRKFHHDDSNDYDQQVHLSRRTSSNIYVTVTPELSATQTETTLVENEERIYYTKKTILLTLGQCLLQYGSPCHRVEDTLKHAAHMLAIDASFSIVPDLVLVSFMPPTPHHSSGKHPSMTQNNATNEKGNIERPCSSCPSVPPLAASETLSIKTAMAFDTHKLVLVSRSMNNLYKGDISLDACLCELREIMGSPATAGYWSTMLAFILIGFSATACMFNGTWYDALAAAGLGWVVSLLLIASTLFPVYGPVFEVSSCVFVGIMGRVLHNYVCFSRLGVSSILILLPGYGMTMAVMEISARQVTTGAIRLIYALVYTFMLAYGLQIGSSTYLAIDPSVPEEGTCGDPVSPWFYIPLVPIMSIAIGLAYGSSRHEFLSQTFCATIGFCILYFLGQVVTDAQVLSTIAAFAMGLYANLALKLTGQPPLAPLCVGITLLVPGSTGVRDAFTLLTTQDPIQGDFTIHMLKIALGISVGLYTAAMIVYPSGKLRSMYISL